MVRETRPPMITTTTAVDRGLHVANARAAPSGATGCYTAARMSPAPDGTLARAMAPRITRRAARRRPTAAPETMRPGPTVETSNDVQAVHLVERALGEASTNLAATPRRCSREPAASMPDADVIE